MNLDTPIVLTDFSQKTFSFNSVKSLEAFIKKEMDFWGKQINISGQNPTANAYIQKFSSFQAIFNQMTAWEPEFKIWDANTLYTNLVNFVTSHLGASWLWSGHAFVEKWLELNQTSANTADAFFEAVVLKTTSQFAKGIDYFQGYLIAYEYINQNNTKINTRRSSEKKALSKLGDQLLARHDELIGKVDKLESDFSEWYQSQVTLLDNTVLAQSKDFYGQLANWIDQKTNLENRYREELRFESVAEIWGKKVTSFRTQGYCWAAGLAVVLVVGVWIFSQYFLAWLSGQPSGLGLQSIEGVLIFITILSTYAFLIKSLSKLTFSAFHLQRDAEEREQLTHLYLNLRDGKDDDVESRKIILQSLFSRSETGLLSGDSGPVMPIQELIQVIKK